MVKKIIKTNPNLIELINKLNKKSKTENAAIWKDVANRLGRSNRRTAELIYQILQGMQMLMKLF